VADREQLERAIAALEAQRAILGDEVAEMALGPLRSQLAALTNPPATEQRKQVTVLFADLVGFTSLAVRMDPEDVRTIMDLYFQRVSEALLRHGGQIEKFIGDAVMAVFGVPTASERDPEQAVRAALAMQQALGELNQELEQQRGLRLTMRIGINTGLVLVGLLDKARNGDLTVVGETVNLASRLEQAAPPGGILISYDSYRHVRGLFELQGPITLAVKGKPDPLQVYLVQGARPRAFRFGSRGVEGVATRLVGREAELALLQQALTVVRVLGESQVITMSGEAGVGKSRLLDEFEQRLAVMPEPVWLFKARAGQEWSRLPYSLIRDLFATRCGIQEGDRAVQARAKLEQEMVRVLGPSGVEQAHFIGHLIGLDFSNSPHLSGILEDARQVRDRAFHAVQSFFGALAAPGEAGGRPVVLFLEDIHWADEGSLDLIDVLTQNNRSLPLLIVALARPTLFEQRPAWGTGQSWHQHVALVPLSQEASQQLVTEILQKVAQVPPALAQLIVNGAEGNPFYMEELVKMLIEDGVILVPNGSGPWGVRLERLAEVKVPATLTGILQARLDALSATERETLQRASVVGRIFWESAVARLHETTNQEARHHPDRTHEALGALRSRELIYEQQASAFGEWQEYSFKHTILRDVTYESVLVRLRRVYHAQVAEWLIERSAERADEYAGLIAEHFERAGDRAAAAQWYARGAEQAEASTAFAMAHDYYRQALSFLPNDGGHLAQRVKLLEGQGRVLLSLSRSREALEAFEQMRLLAKANHDLAAQGRAWFRSSVAQSDQGDHRAALASVEQAEGAARASGAQLLLAQALHWRGAVLYRLGEAHAALTLAEEALTLSTALNARVEMEDCFSLLGWVHTLLGNVARSEQYKRRALALARELGNRRLEAIMLNSLGESARRQGNYALALALYEQSLTIARAIGDQANELVILNNIGAARVGLGAYEEAEAELRRLIGRLTDPNWFVLPESYYFLALAYLGQGKVKKALAAARRALALGQQIGSQEYQGMAWRALGMVAAAYHQPMAVGESFQSASDCFAESARIFANMEAAGEHAITLQAWGHYELEQGDRARGEALLREAQAGIREGV
jgi:predicted ATPase/class 3 adenylate cyclase